MPDMNMLACPTCKSRFTNVTITGGTVCCPQCGELMFNVPTAATREEFMASLTDEYFKESADQLEYFYTGWSMKRQSSRILIISRICGELAARLPDSIA